jgi:predicted transcriptional regulator
MFDISKLPPALLDVLRKAAAGDYHRADLDDLVKRWHRRDTIPTMSDAEIMAYLQEPLPPVDHWLSVAVRCGLIDADTSLPTPLGLAALEMQQTTTPPKGQPAAKSRGPNAEGEQPLSLTQEDAAILKVLLQANGVMLTVDKIVAKVCFTDKTIRTRLKNLREFGLVREPEKKKGYTTTAKGTDVAKGLPADAGAKLIQSERAGR